jgi:hypothetical protein
MFFDLPIIHLGNDAWSSLLAQEAEISGTKDAFGDRVWLTRNKTLRFVHFDRIPGDFRIPKVLVWDAIVIALVARGNLSRAWARDLYRRQLHSQFKDTVDLQR